MNDTTLQNRGTHAVGSRASTRRRIPAPTAPATGPLKPGGPKPYHRHGHRPPELST